MYQKKLIKSLIKFKDSEALTLLVSKEKAIFTDKQCLALFATIKELAGRYNEVPDSKLLREYFKLEKDSQAKVIFEELSSDKSIELVRNVKALAELQLSHFVKSQTSDLLKEYQSSMRICNGSETRKLNSDLIDELVKLGKTLETDERRSGLIYHDPDISPENEIKKQIISTYDLRKTGGQKYYKFDTGFPQIDQVIGGVHSVDFIGILGYVKNGKSYFVRKIAYNVLCQGKNVVFVTLEMSYESVLNSFMALHANNTERWGYDSVKIKTADLRSGTLQPKAETFFKEQVIGDFTSNPDMGTLYITQPVGRYQPRDLFAEIRDIKNNIMDIDLIIIDYPSLITPSTGHRDRDSYNELFRELRHFSLTQHIPIIFPVQCNRAGYDSALKDRENLFKPDAISDFSSIERECTHVFSILTTPEMKESQQAQVQHLLSRESELFAPMRIGADFETGMLVTLTNLSQEDSEQIIEELDV